VRILNRCRIELVGYQGLVVEEFSSSPDGVLREDLLADLPASSRSLDGSSGKYSGDWIAAFDPRHCSQIRLIVADRVGASIALRNVTVLGAEPHGSVAKPGDYPARSRSKVLAFPTHRRPQ
jgi:hypothetical protein